MFSHCSHQQLFGRLKLLWRGEQHAVPSRQWEKKKKANVHSLKIKEVRQDYRYTRILNITASEGFTLLELNIVRVQGSLCWRWCVNTVCDLTGFFHKMTPYSRNGGVSPTLHISAASSSEFIDSVSPVEVWNVI